MKTEVEHTNRLTILSPSGRLDAHAAPEMRDMLHRLQDEGHHQILVDMSSVSFVDSTGLTVLVSGMKRCRQAGGDLALTQLQQSVRIIFELTRLDKAFEIHPDRATAAWSGS